MTLWEVAWQKIVWLGVGAAAPVIAAALLGGFSPGALERALAIFDN